MKKIRKNTRDNYTFFHDIAETYRYPDGTLNKIAVLISALAIALIVVLGHFTVTSVKHFRSLKNVSANELMENNDESNNEYIDTKASSLTTEYTKEEIEQLISLLENELVSNTNIDDSHYQELCSQLELLKTYSDTQIIDNTADLNSLIDQLKKTYENSIGAKIYDSNETYQKGDYVIYGGKLYISLVDNNTSDPTNSSSWKVADIETIITNLEKQTAELDKVLEKQEQQLTEQDNNLQEQIDVINEHISDNSTFFEFGYDPSSGAYGYYVNDEFKPW